MIAKPMDVLSQFPVRRSKAQRQAFRESVRTYAESLGYSVTVEEGKQDVKNVIMGDPNTADYLVTAHYDTPAVSPLPNVMTPNNPVVFILYQVAVILSYFAIACLICLPVYFLTQNTTATFLVWYFVYMVMAFLPRFGPANRNNVNDNTSGVIALLEIARSMPETCRNRVAFILFDQEEKGLVGSAAYRKAHKSETENKVVLNLDCVGDGDIIQLLPVKKARKDTALLDKLSGICCKVGAKELRLWAKGFSAANSDHKNFPKGVGMMAFHYKKGIGLYCGRIHTPRDTILDQTNVNIIRAAIVTLICQ